MLEIIGGIVLAFLILGLLEEVPDWFWYCFLGVLVVIAIWLLWPSFWSDVLEFVLIISVIVLIGIGWTWLGKTINNHKKHN